MTKTDMKKKYGIKVFIYAISMGSVAMFFIIKAIKLLN